MTQLGWDMWDGCQLLILLNSCPLGGVVSFCAAGSQERRKSPEFSLWSWPKLELSWRIPQEVSAQCVQDELGITSHCAATGCLTCFTILLFVRLFAEPVLCDQLSTFPNS